MIILPFKTDYEKRTYRRLTSSLDESNKHHQMCDYIQYWKDVGISYAGSGMPKNSLGVPGGFVYKNVIDANSGGWSIASEFENELRQWQLDIYQVKNPTVPRASSLGANKPKTQRKANHAFRTDIETISYIVEDLHTIMQTYELPEPEILLEEYGDLETYQIRYFLSSSLAPSSSKIQVIRAWAKETDKDTSKDTSKDTKILFNFVVSKGGNGASRVESDVSLEQVLDMAIEKDIF